MEITHPVDPTIVTFEPDKELMFDLKFSQTKMSMLTERMSEANEVLGMNNQLAGRVTSQGGNNDDVLLFTANKKYAKYLKGTKYDSLWQMHTSKYWDNQMKEVEVLAEAVVKEEMKNMPHPRDSGGEIDAPSGIVLH
jgi:hypothetical protein